MKLSNPSSLPAACSHIKTRSLRCGGIFTPLHRQRISARWKKQSDSAALLFKQISPRRIAWDCGEGGSVFLATRPHFSPRKLKRMEILGLLSSLKAFYLHNLGFGTAMTRSFGINEMKALCNIRNLHVLDGGNSKAQNLTKDTFCQWHFVTCLCPKRGGLFSEFCSIILCVKYWDEADVEFGTEYSG